MPPNYFYNDPDGGLTDLTDHFRLYRMDVSQAAEEGRVEQCNVVADDPGGLLDIDGQRPFYITESTATGSNQRIYNGYTADREVSRGVYRVGADREWSINLVDLNWLIGRRVFTASRANRPAETDVARVQWLLGTNELGNVNDDLYVSTASPVAMDAVDYRGQTPEDVLNDCAQQSGKNYFVWWREETAESSLFYDFHSSAVYQSPIRLTNVLSEVDGVWTFEISQDTTLKRDPSRVVSGVYLQYDGGTVYESNLTTANAFSYRDSVSYAENVKTAAKATTRAQRYLSDNSTEDDVITTTVRLPLAKQGFLREGMRVQIRATHLPGYESYTWGRVLTRTIAQPDSEEYYSVKYEISVGPPVAPSPGACDSPYAATPSGSYAPLGSATTNSDAVVYYARAGSPAPIVPTPGSVGNPNFPVYTGGGGPDYIGDCAASYVRVMVVGAGTLEVGSAIYDGTPRDITATLYHWDYTEGEAHVDDPQSGTTGDTFTFDVDTHGGTDCVHFVDLVDTGEPCGGKYGFTGADWTSSE